MKNNWTTIKLGDLFEFKYGRGLTAEHRQAGGSVRVYGSNGVIGRHNNPLSQGPTIIIGRKGSVGEINFSPTACWPIDTTYYIDEFPNEFPPQYWALYLKSLRLGSHDKSSAIPGVSRKDIYSIDVSIPPIPEQQRIVAKLGKLLAKVEAYQERLNKIPALLKRFRQSVLTAACSGNLTADWRKENCVNDEWSVQSLGEIFTMRNGKSLTAIKRKIGDIPVYGGNGLMGMHNKENAEGQIIVIGRVGAQCGNVHYVSGKVWVTDNAISFQAKNDVVPAFYAFFLRSQNLNQLSGGTGQPYVSQEILAPLEAPVVSLSEQQEIVRRVEALLKIADQIEERYKKAKALH